MENALHLIFSLTFVFIFQSISGVQNVLPGVAISVGMAIFLDGYIGVRPITMTGVIIELYYGYVIAGQAALMLPTTALVIGFLFVLLIMALTCEPAMYKSVTSFLLCFVFAQSTPISPTASPIRLAGAVASVATVAVTTAIKWYWQGHGKEGRGLKEQVRLCMAQKGHILWMPIGIAAATFISMILHLRKPLWTSVVVMSLTQLHYHEALERIRHRFLGSVPGILFFVVIFRMLVPEGWAFGVVLFLGYISSFTSEYKYKQIVNAVSAIDTSLVLLDTSTAIESKLLCLTGGACIVLILYLARKLGRGIMGHIGATATCRIKWCENYRYDLMESCRWAWYNREKWYNIA